MKEHEMAISTTHFMCCCATKVINEKKGMNIRGDN